MVEFNPCNTCRYYRAEVCGECMEDGLFEHYRHTETDINDLPPFPLDEFLTLYNERERLVAVGIYLKAMFDHLQRKSGHDT